MTAHGVVVLNYRGKEDTLACLNSIAQGDNELIIYVVDNGSDDGVIDDASSMWPEVRTLAISENKGFSGGMNTGIRRALEDGCTTITILNNDTIIPAGTLSRLADLAGSWSAVSPTVRYADDPESIWFGGGIVDGSLGVPRHLNAAELGESPSDSGLRDTEILAGCCVTASADVWQRVGLLDDRYFLNFEDSDWSVRATDAGIQLHVATHEYILHKVSASFKGEYSYLGYYYYIRNGFLFGISRVQDPRRFMWKFARHQVLPSLWRPWREGDRSTALRRSILLGHALSALAMHRLGRASELTERRAAKWAQGH